MPYIGRSTDGFGVRNRFLYLASASDTSVSGADANGATLSFSDGAYVDVYLNGVLLKAGTDYNTNTANTIAGISSMSANDEVTVIVYDIFAVADTVSQSSGGTFTGNVNFSGNIDVDGTANLDVVDIDGNVDIAGTSTLNDDVTFTGANYNVVWDKSDDALEFADGAELRFGAGDDLKIRHDTSGNNSRIIESGTGSLIIQAENLNMSSANAGEDYIRCVKDGSVSLYYDDVKKLETTTNGIVVGGVTAETHHSSMKTVQVGARGFLTPYDSGATYLTSNVFYNASGSWEFASAGGGNALSLNDGDLYYYRVQDGSDGGTASLVQALKIDQATGYTEWTANRNSVGHYLGNIHGTSPYGIYFQFPNVSPDNNDNYFLTCHDSTTARLRIYSDGDVVNHDNAYGSTSDERLKQDIVDANSQWDDIKNIKIRNFKKKDDIKKYGDKAWSQIGVVAQELETVSPKLIRETEPSESDVEIDSSFGTVVDDTDSPIYYTEADTIPNGKKVGDIKEYKKKVETKSTVKAVVYSVLYMKALKALQEAMARIETLEAKVKTLEEA